MDEIVSETKNANVIVHHLDLASLKQVREFAAKINETESRLDVLIHNAGYVNYLKQAVTEDGIEMTMATNHYGPFLLTHLLIDLMKKSAPARIVVVASKTHTLSTYRFAGELTDARLNPVGYPFVGLLYGDSKFANIMTTIEMSRRLQKFNISITCLHPGVIDTGIWRNVPFPFSIFMAIAKKYFLKTLQEGIQTILYCALSPEIEGITGRYFRDCRIGSPHRKVYRSDFVETLFRKSREIVGLTDEDPQI